MAPFLVLLLFITSPETAATAVIRSRKPLKDGQTLLSPRQFYEMGFFSPGNSQNRYLAIWFRKSQPPLVVWIFNRSKPLNSSSGILLIDRMGNLLLLSGPSGEPIWSTPRKSNSSNAIVQAELQDSGNFVLRSRKNILWQTLDEPQNVMLPGMKLSVEKSLGAINFLSSWKTRDDPSMGRFTFKMDYSSVRPRLLLYKGSTIQYSAGHFNGFRFTGVPSMQPNSFVKYLVKITPSEAEYWFEMESNSTSSVLALSDGGVVQRLIFEKETKKWRVFTNSPADVCGQFANCGSFGICNMSNFPVCGCMEGYKPRDEGEWRRQNAGGGCVRKTAAVCGAAAERRDGFLVLEQLKLPHLVNATVDLELSFGQCREKCAVDCSCAAFAAANVSDPRGGCITWHGELLDVRVLDTRVQDLFIRVSKSSLMKPFTENGKGDTYVNRERKPSLTLILCYLLLGLSLTLFCCFFLTREKTIKLEEKGLLLEMQTGDEEIPFFSLQVLAAATVNFSQENKIGEGGFGIVYKGILPDGTEVAVKRLMNVSISGQNEFTNEVRALAKLKHRNLVQLLGYCISKEEKILIYEYMKNKSLDAFIFDEHKRSLLGWGTRLDIIMGIARGLEYLHHDSGSRIIHRDLKAWNILLDGEMVPKISDFGTARIFGEDQMLAKTRKIVGTYGYMSPEYAIDGVISMKSDVFSFGVLVMEILSGVRNRSLCITEYQESLLSKAWRLWLEGNCAKLLDQSTSDMCHIPEAIRCIHVALLCVQERPVDRPTMAVAAMMLSTESYELPTPKRPGFVIFQNPKDATASSSGVPQKLTRVEITITDLVGR